MKRIKFKMLNHERKGWNKVNKTNTQKKKRKKKKKLTV